MAVSGTLYAEGQGEQVLTNVRYPLKDSDGNKRGELSGRVFRVQEDGPVEVEGLHWRMIREDGTEVNVTSETCRYNKGDGVISSEDKIRITRGEVTMTGRRYICDLKKERLMILKDVRVVIRGKELWNWHGKTEE